MYDLQGHAGTLPLCRLRLQHVYKLRDKAK